MGATLCLNVAPPLPFFLQLKKHQIVIKSQLASPWTPYGPKQYQACVPVVAEIVWLLAIVPKQNVIWVDGAEFEIGNVPYVAI